MSSNVPYQIPSRSYRYKLINKYVNDTVQLAQLDSLVKCTNSRSHRNYSYVSGVIDGDLHIRGNYVNSNFNKEELPSYSNSDIVESDQYVSGNYADCNVNEAEFLPSSSSSSYRQSSEDDEMLTGDGICSEDLPTTRNSADFLIPWAIKNNITHKALSELLTWFSTKPDITALPIDARTLLGTPRNVQVQRQGNGEFFYGGMKEKFTLLCSQHKHIKELMLDFNIDGLPLHKSTKLSFWPILCLVNGFEKEYIFPVAVYCGQSKPPLAEYLRNFVAELLELQTNGITLNNHHVVIKIRSFCCDTPARSYIKNIKGHNGASGCDKCCVRGQYKDRRMLFLDLRAPKRTDEGVLCQVDDSHHNGNTPLSALLNIGLVSQFPVDYMHCVCLGVMRKLLFNWRDKGRQVGISKGMISDLEAKIKDVQSYWPSDFNRKPRSLSELEKWKATELQQFLLYVGPALLKNIFPKRIFCNFMLLKSAITILLVPKLNDIYNDSANYLLQEFVKHAVKIYGQSFCTYNTHALIHLAADAQQFGTLNTITCFPFENFLQSLKKMLRKSNQPLQQVIRRLEEMNGSNCLEIKDNLLKKNRTFQLKQPIEPVQRFENYSGNGQFFRKLDYDRFHLSTAEGNNCVQFHDQAFAKILYFFKYHHSDNVHVICEKLSVKESFDEYPIDSKLLSMYIVMQ